MNGILETELPDYPDWGMTLENSLTDSTEWQRSTGMSSLYRDRVRIRIVRILEREILN